jgi:predicted transcriptional regulator
MMRPGSAGSNTAADHLTLLDEAIAALPPAFRRRLMVTCDGAGASHDLVKRLDALASRRGYELVYSVGWALTEREKTALALVPDTAWEAAIDAGGKVRERRSDEACENARCGHRACWIEEAHVTELTGLLRKGTGGDRPKAWPKTMRVFARRERPHPGASSPCSRPPTGDATPCGRRTCRKTPGAGAASAPTSTQATGSTPGPGT